MQNTHMYRNIIEHQREGYYAIYNVNKTGEHNVSHIMKRIQKAISDGWNLVSRIPRGRHWNGSCLGGHLKEMQRYRIKSTNSS